MKAPLRVLSACCSRPTSEGCPPPHAPSDTCGRKGVERSLPVKLADAREPSGTSARSQRPESRPFDPVDPGPSLISVASLLESHSSRDGHSSFQAEGRRFDSRRFSPNAALTVPRVLLPRRDWCVLRRTSGGGSLRFSLRR